jgi:ABC-type polar amino acid transport system ATPase subunit
MRITSIQVRNFKSLVDFQISLEKFSCLIGLNGVGKSTVLQFIDFLSHLVRGDTEAWLEERKWKPADLKSKLTRKLNIDFTVTFEEENNPLPAYWKATYNPRLNRCTEESFVSLAFTLATNKGAVEISHLLSAPKAHEIVFDYSGSILSALKEDLLPDEALNWKRYFEKLSSLDLLSPEYLRQRTRDSFRTLGLGGKNLASMIHDMDHGKVHQLYHTLKSVYPSLLGLHAKSLPSGWKQLEISESFAGRESGLLPSMGTQARHINDGMLRLIAIFAQLQSENQFLLFDEIENGINPEVVEFVMDRLVHAAQQILVTTHSPMILNYLDDDVAKNGVIYLYKTNEGHTKSIPFFSIPSLAEKLTMMGAGEAFIDTDLTHLSDEIERLTEAK